MDPLPETAAAMQLLTPDDTHLADSLCQAGLRSCRRSPHGHGVQPRSRRGRHHADVRVLGRGPASARFRPVPLGRTLRKRRQRGRAAGVRPRRPARRAVVGDLFARASAARGVHSTLSLPILRDGAVIAGVNIYGHREGHLPRTPRRRGEGLRCVAPGAVSNADLSFSTRVEAVKAPVLIGDMTLLEDGRGGVRGPLRDLHPRPPGRSFSSRRPGPASRSACWHGSSSTSWRRALPEAPPR